MSRKTLEILIELKNNISTLAYCLEHDGTVSEVKSKSFSKSLTAIYILQSSLDMKLGGEIAENLYNLYEYCRTTIIKAFRSKDFLSVQSLVPILNEILDGDITEVIEKLKIAEQQELMASDI